MAFPFVLVAPPDETPLGVGLFRDLLKDEKVSPINDSFLSEHETAVVQPIEGRGVVFDPSGKVKLGGR